MATAHACQWSHTVNVFSGSEGVFLRSQNLSHMDFSEDAHNWQFSAVGERML